MRGFKSFLGVAGVLLPVLYCGGLVYYFLDLSGSVQEAEDTGLGPTVIGLAAVGVLFSIPLFLKIIRLIVRPPSSRPDDDDPAEDFDAEAAIARYKAQRSAETSPPPPAPRGKRPTFGRR